MGRASVRIRSEADRKLILDWAYRAPKGTTVTFKADSRSPEQNDLMWARLTDISRAVAWYGRKLKPEDWKTIFTASLRKSDVIPGIDPGTVVPLGLSTSDMTVSEMTALLDLIDAFAAERGVTFKEEIAA